MAKEDSFLKILGIVLMILGGAAVILAFPMGLQSVVSVGSIQISGVNEISATRIAVGVVLFVLGLLAYNKK
jgi:hypothetical protein